MRGQGKNIFYQKRKVKTEARPSSLSKNKKEKEYLKLLIFLSNELLFTTKREKQGFQFNSEKELKEIINKLFENHSLQESIALKENAKKRIIIDLQKEFRFSFNEKMETALQSGRPTRKKMLMLMNIKDVYQEEMSQFNTAI